MYDTFAYCRVALAVRVSSVPFSAGCADERSREIEPRSRNLDMNLESVQNIFFTAF